MLIKKISSERFCCAGLLGRGCKCSWLILKQHLSREKLRKPKNRWSSGRELSWLLLRFEPRVRVGQNHDVSLPSTCETETFESEFLFFVAVINLVTCLNRVKWAGWLYINVFAVFADILTFWRRNYFF